MKTIGTKLALSALAIATLATPALAAGKHRQAASYQGLQNSAVGQTDVGTYSNGATRSGSAYSLESGAADNVIR
jgi:hypothetical protein